MLLSKRRKMYRDFVSAAKQYCTDGPHYWKILEKKIISKQWSFEKQRIANLFGALYF